MDQGLWQVSWKCTTSQFSNHKQVDLFSFVFWKNLKTPKRHFEINWPLKQTHFIENIVFKMNFSGVCENERYYQYMRFGYQSRPNLLIIIYFSIVTAQYFMLHTYLPTSVNYFSYLLRPFLNILVLVQKNVNKSAIIWKPSNNLDIFK